MRRLLSAAGLTAALLAGWAWAAAAENPPAVQARAPGVAEDVQDLVFLADARPVLIRLHVRIDGKPFRTVYRSAQEDYVRHLFRHLDRKGKGFLSEAEARRLPPPLRLGASGGTPVNVAFNFKVIDTDGDGKVTLKELLDYYDEYGGGALQAHFDAGRPSVSASLGEALFTRLDANKDGKLDADELKAAPKTLSRLDLNGDDVLTPDELAPRLFLRTPAQVAGGFVMPAPAPRPAESPFIVLSPGPQDNLGERILRRYAAQGSGAGPDRKALGLDGPTFDRLDANKDGKLDADELEKFADRAADVELIVRLGKTAPGEASLEVVNPGGRKAAPPGVRTSSSGTVILTFGKTQVEFSGNRSRPRLVDGTRQGHLQRFRADAGAQGYLTRADARRVEFFPALFPLLDRDGDGKLTEKELLAYLDDVQERQAVTVGLVTALRVSAEGGGLFDLLDANRDGRLGLREVRSAAGLLDRLGRARAGHLTPDDIPRTFRVALGLGRARFDRADGGVLTPPGLPLLRLDWSRPGLIWFYKMDRNHDGDVSPREFLGTAEHFKRLDADGDGLISPEEAERAEALFRKKKP